MHEDRAGRSHRKEGNCEFQGEAGLVGANSSQVSVTQPREKGISCRAKMQQCCREEQTSCSNHVCWHQQGKGTFKVLQSKWPADGWHDWNYYLFFSLIKLRRIAFGKSFNCLFNFLPMHLNVLIKSQNLHLCMTCEGRSDSRSALWFPWSANDLPFHRQVGPGSELSSQARWCSDCNIPQSRWGFSECSAGLVELNSVEFVSFSLSLYSPIRNHLGLLHAWSAVL